MNWNGSRAEVSEWVKGVLDGSGLPGRELADVLDTTENTVCRWRTGRSLPRSLGARRGLEDMAGAEKSKKI